MTCRQSSTPEPHRRALPLPFLAAGLPADEVGGEETHQLVELAIGESPRVLGPRLLPVSVCCLDRRIIGIE
jgi:hypothetical protein